jgi:large-conductance mechanosensitive channel
MEHFRSLYWIIILDPGLRILDEWEKLNQSHKVRNIIGLVIHLFIFGIALYFSFCFCAVYSSQAPTWLYALFCTILIDFLIFEIIWEIIIALFYNCRKKSRSLLRIAEFLNRTRSIKCLS